MKIEKLNENQIRCTLNKDDLSKRQIKLSELAYGSDKAKRLFRDMMIQASTEVGFEANDIPLVIEAIPVSSDCIVLIVTKVEDPEELDTRFSKFSPTNISLDEDIDTDAPSEQSPAHHSAADILDLFKKISEGLLNKEAESDTAQTNPSSDFSAKPEVSAPVDMTKIFRFGQLDDVCRYASIIYPRYTSQNSLYKDPKSRNFYLVLTKGNASPELYNKVCNIAVEYGEFIPTSSTSVAYYNEHFTLMIKNRAVQKLANL